MKKSLLPSGDIVGLNSGNSLFILRPRFSTLMIVADVITFSFCGISGAVESTAGDARSAVNVSNVLINKQSFFTIRICIYNVWQAH